MAGRLNVKVQKQETLDPVAIEEQLQKWKSENGYDNSAPTPSAKNKTAERKSQQDNSQSIDAALSLLDIFDADYNLKHTSYFQETADFDKGMRQLEGILKKLGVKELDHDLEPIYDATSWYSRGISADKEPFW